MKKTDGMPDKLWRDKGYTLKLRIAIFACGGDHIVQLLVCSLLDAMEYSIVKTATKPANWERLKEQVKSWIESEQRCVTAQRISQTLNVSRMLGTQLLKEILEANMSHQISICRQTQEGNVTAFSLETTTKPALDLPDVSIFAISSLRATESVETSHERDMVQWREMVEEKVFPQAQIAAIEPADEIENEENITLIPSKMLGGVGGHHMPSHLSMHIPLSGESSQSVKAAKMMTASSFFGSQANMKKSQKSTTKPKKALEKIPASSKPVILKSTLSRKENHKPSEMNRSLPETKIGNADDFVADEEESDDEVASVKQEIVCSTKDQKSQQVGHSAEPTRLPCRGSMDTFAKVSKNVSKEVPKSRQKRRRKKLVEKTTTVGGYLRTETVTVWEDILTDEENEDEEKRKEMTKKVPASKAKKNTNNMKQKSLMGFFAKK